MFYLTCSHVGSYILILIYIHKPLISSCKTFKLTHEPRQLIQFRKIIKIKCLKTVENVQAYVSGIIGSVYYYLAIAYLQILFFCMGGGVLYFQHAIFTNAY